MNRRRLGSLILSLWLSVALIIGSWSLSVWQASTQVSASGVKGASTDSRLLDQSQPAPDLGPYLSMGNPSGQLANAKEYALYSLESGQLLARSAQMPPVPIASTTKLMTTYLATKYGTLDDLVTVSPTGGRQIPSVMGLVPGERISVRNLLYGALLVSGNDAAYTLAEYVGGVLLHDQEADSAAKVRRCVDEMNSEAALLSLTDTHYRDPAGLDDEGRSTAVDLAKLTSLVDRQPTLAAIIHTSDITVASADASYQHPLHNSDRLLADMPYAGVVGGKTGYTPEAGHCLIVTAKRANITLIAVILNTNENTSDASALEARRLLDSGFGNLKIE